MKSFPYRLLFICVFLPPICYILTLHGLEQYFKKQAASTLTNIIIQDHEALYEGRYTIKEEINRNIGEYLLGQGIKYALGVRASIVVKTKDDQILYPAHFKKDLNSMPQDLSEGELNYMDVAAENYRILNDGLTLSVDIRIKHNSWLSNSILVFYVFLAILILQKFIRKSVREAERLEEERKESIRELTGKLEEAETKLTDIRIKEDNYEKDIGSLKKDKDNLSTDIDELLEEIERLEAGLEGQRDLREEKEGEVLYLKEEIDRLKGRLQKPEKKKKKIDTAAKRFKVLYKNLLFTERAIDGFLSLSDEFQLKAEEVIHQLNEDDSMVSVKRKVFGKGGKMNILETDFSYSGRIYFQKDSQTKTKIVVIGTKKSQAKDLSFLEREKG